MRVLVTGAAGSLGRVVTAGLAEHDHDVVGLDLVPAPEGSTFAWHEADCTDGDAVAAVFAEERLDAVVHLAGILGGHLVGMSTTLEAIAAREAGMEVLGISLVTNLAAGISDQPLNHEEVLEAGRAAASRMGDLLGQVVPRI